MRAPLAHLVDALDLDAGLLRKACVPRGGDQAEAELEQRRRDRDRARPCRWPAPTGRPGPACGSRVPARDLALPNAAAKLRSMPITSPVERISGPRMRVDAGELHEREDRLLDRHVGRASTSRTSISRSVLPTAMRAAIFASGTPVTLETNGTVREARGLTSRTKIRARRAAPRTARSSGRARPAPWPARAPGP